MKTTIRKRESHSGIESPVTCFSPWSRVGVIGVVLLLTAWAPLANAQYIRFKAGRVRVTVPANSAATSVVITNQVTLNGLDANGATLSVSGLPTGATATLSATTLTASGPLNLTVNAANIPEGVYTFSLNGSGTDTNSQPVTGTLLLTLQAGVFWGASTVPANWGDAGSWVGGVVAGVGDDVIFNEKGGQSSALVNIVVNGDATVGSMRFTQTNSANKFHTVQINPGKTLSVTGPNGFSILRDYVSSVASIAQGATVTVTGLNGTLVISNQDANIATLVDNSQANTLDLSGLGNFQAAVNRIGLGDYQLWPNFDNLSTTNAYNGIPSKFYTVLSLARTNVIKATYVDPNSFTNSVRRDYSLVLGNNERGGTSSSPLYNLNLGISNALYLDSLCITHASMSGNMQFNTTFAASSPVAIFRGMDGGRMSMWAESDMGQGTAAMASGSNDKTTVDLSAGTVDALIDRLYLSRDRINSSGQNSQSSLILSRGVFDVNTAILGYQGEGNHTNTAYCEGTLVVSNTAVFKVNQEMILGYTSADPGDPTANDVTGNNGTWGRIYLGPGGKLMANTISCGGATKTSLNQANQFINLNAGAELVLTNGLGSTTAPLNALNLANGSALTLNLSGTNTMVYVKTLTTSGVGANANLINVASVANLDSFPVKIPIISYVNPTTAAFAIGATPPGTSAYVINDTANSTINLTINTNTPQTLVWSGAVNNVWDTTTTNWVVQTDLTPTVFSDGDNVVFNDTAAGGTITLANDVVPGQSATTPGILVSNSAASYTFEGPGMMRGSATLQKAGSGTLTLNTTSENSVLVSGGALAGSASTTIGNTVLQTGVSLVGFAGTINGGLDASNAAVSISGAVNGPVVLRAGALTNNGTLSGTMSLSANTYLTNGNTINVTVPWSVPTNSTLVNNGTIVQIGPSGGNYGLTVSAGGTLMGVGKITSPGTNLLSDVRVTMAGNLVIGNKPNEIASMTIATRLDFLAGSTSTFDVDLANTNDLIILTDGFIQGKVNFGANNSLGGTLVVNRLGLIPFTSSSVLHLFDITSNSPDNSKPAKPEVIPAPGPGLVWDISNMLTNLTLAVTGPPVLGAVFTKTNVTLSWPDLYRGWQLQAQTNTLELGLSTNWANIAGSFGTNSVVLPVVPGNPAVFYRMVYP